MSSATIRSHCTGIGLCDMSTSKRAPDNDINCHPLTGYATSAIPQIASVLYSLHQSNIKIVPIVMSHSYHDHQKIPIQVINVYILPFLIQSRPHFAYYPTSRSHNHRGPNHAFPPLSHASFSLILSHSAGV